MLSPSDIGWGGYEQHRGPFYRGTCPFVMPDKPTQEDRIMAVITACEGGHYDAVNMYDDGILSSGLIQWIEAGQFSVSGMLGAVYGARGKEAMQPLVPALDLAGAAFMKSERTGKFRFYFLDGNKDPFNEVDTTIEQRMLFTGGSDEEGSWTEPNKLLAKTWAACVAEIWKDPDNQHIQRKFTADRLSQFVRPAAHKVFLAMNMSGAEPNILEAAYAAYLSFAVNNPTRAERHLLKADDNGVYDQSWLNAMLKELTYGPGVAIYPARYSAIKPILQQLYGVNLDPIDVFNATVTMFVDEAQKTLIKLGYDLGPWGADGKFGAKTKRALTAFQRVHVVNTGDWDGTLNAATCQALKKLA